MAWLEEYSEEAKLTDKLIGKPNHAALLAAGLMGEAGGILAESKKKERDRKAYPAYRNRMSEEIGDFLWYYVRLIDIHQPSLVTVLEGKRIKIIKSSKGGSLHPLFLNLGASVGSVLSAVNGGSTTEIVKSLEDVWYILKNLSQNLNISLSKTAKENVKKIQSRWPEKFEYHDLFDHEYFEENQLPRHLEIEFIERIIDKKKTVVLRYKNMNFGNPLTDNINDPDGYRYHDIFHFSHAVHLGWSPVIRALLKCKRKSKPKVDMNQDGLRAVVIEEGIAATVFSRAKNLKYFDGIENVDYNLLKTIQESVEGYEVDKIPLWQWEKAILNGYEIFRKLKKNNGGTVTIDIEKRKLKYKAPLKI